MLFSFPEKIVNLLVCYMRSFPLSRNYDAQRNLSWTTKNSRNTDRYRKGAHRGPPSHEHGMDRQTQFTRTTDDERSCANTNDEHDCRSIQPLLDISLHDHIENLLTVSNRFI